MNKQIAKYLTVSLLGTVFGFAMTTHAATTDLASEPMAVTQNMPIKPNILFLLDDSGSMAWDRLSPDTMAQTNSNADYCNMNSAYNGVYYNPSMTYVLPVTSTGANYANSTFTSARDDGFDVTNPTTSNLSSGFKTGGGSNNAISLISGIVTSSSSGGPGFYFNYHQTTFIALAVSGTTSTTVSSITVNGVQLMSGTSAGCSSGCGTMANTIAANIAAKITMNGFSATTKGSIIIITGPYSAAGYAPVITQSGGNMVISSVPITTLTVSGTVSTSVTGITVNSVQLMSGSSTASVNSSTVAANIASRITAGSFIATSSGNNVMIIGPASSAGFTPTISKSGSMTIVPNGAMVASKFISDGSPGTAVTGVCYPDTNYTLVTLTSAATEAQNFANWYSYYRTRILTMKSAAGRAFKNITSDFRVGFSTINTIDNSTPMVVNINDFDAAQKSSWYSAFYAITPNSSTPLRVALAHAGQMYAHKLSGAPDPVQYSCQQNFTIMTTDGMWNDNTNPKQLNGTTDVGNPDAFAPRPMYDGSSFTQTSTQITQRTSIQYANTTQAQAQQTQKSTGTLQSTAYALKNLPSYLQSQTSQVAKVTTTLQGTLSKVLMKCNNTSATCGTAPSTGIANANWTVVTSGSCTTATNVQCAVVSGLSGTSNVATACDTSASIGTTTSSYPSVTVTITNANNAAIDRIRADGTSGSRILDATTASSSSNSTVASRIAAGINNCTASATGNCDVSGHSATVGTGANNNVITITGPNVTASLSVRVSSGSATITVSALIPGVTTYTLNNADSNGKVYSACSYGSSSTTGVASCTAVAQSSSNPYTVLTAVSCPATPVVTSAWANTNATCTVTTTPDVNGYTTQCRYNTPSATPSTVASCTYQKRSSSSPYTVLTENLCSYAATSPTVTNVSSCTDVPYTTSTADGTVWDPTAHTCGYSWTTPANASSCTPVNPSTSSPYTVGTATQCTTPWIGVQAGTCSAGTGGVLACQTVTGSTAVASCTASTASSGNQWVTTTCPAATTTPWIGVASCTPATASAANNYVATNCNTVTQSATVASCTTAAASAANNWTATSCAAAAGGTANTLADVAYYYYETDLRDSSLNNCTGALGGTTDVCKDNVRGSGLDNYQTQHMTTFTLGLGVVGTVDPDTPGHYYPYPPSASTDFQNLYTGPNNWPAPVSNTETTVDDLWHAAVNGRGQYFSAKDPNSLVSGLNSALQGVQALQGASAAASTSNMQPVPGDNYAYVATFTTLQWDGDLLAEEIDPVSGAFVIDPLTGKPLIVWQAQPLLDTQVSAAGTTPATDTRTIYTFDGTTANKLKPFTWANLNATEQAYFNNMCGTPYLLAQCATLAANDAANATSTVASANTGANLVNYLRGQHDFEDLAINSANQRVFRPRYHVLGDIVSAQPQYVKKPTFDYNDSGYAAFKTLQLNRTPVVYSGANDGMLHAFNATTGVELWAYIPPLMLPDLYRLASEDTPTASPYYYTHRYYVDGTPTVADICPKAPAATCADVDWKTILVGGFNDGGRGFYALDITDPIHPKALWNYSAANQLNLGFAYGSPQIVKRQDSCNVSTGICSGGTWVVAFTSGYNNVNPGDGQGHLFILNAYTGVQLEDIVTTTTIQTGGTATFTGDTTTPSGLAASTAYVENPNDNTALRFYAGDLLGHVWRLNIDTSAIPSGKGAFMLAQLGNVDLAYAQPVTVRPEMAEIAAGGVNRVIVFIGTGRYLGVSDLSNVDIQSVYAFKDDFTTTPLGLVRSPGKLIKQTLTSYTGNGKTYRQSTNNPVNWATDNGWYVDFVSPANALHPEYSSPGERVNIPMNLQQTTLTVTTNVPDSNACNIGGYSWMYYFNFTNGYLAPLAGIRDVSNSMVAGTTQIMDSTGKTHTIVTHTDGTVTVQDDIAPPPVLGVSRRSSWRELTF